MKTRLICTGSSLNLKERLKVNKRSNPFDIIMKVLINMNNIDNNDNLITSYNYHDFQLF